MLGHPCSGQHPQPQLLPSVYQAALNHAGPYGHGRNVSHTPWEAVTFVAVSAVIVPAIFKIIPSVCLLLLYIRAIRLKCWHFTRSVGAARLIYHGTWCSSFKLGPLLNRIAWAHGIANAIQRIGTPSLYLYCLVCCMWTKCSIHVDHVDAINDVYNIYSRAGLK